MWESKINGNEYMNMKYVNVIRQNYDLKFYDPKSVVCWGENPFNLVRPYRVVSTG